MQDRWSARLGELQLRRGAACWVGALERNDLCSVTADFHAGRKVRHIGRRKRGIRSRA